jgi:hypothetical protein
LFTDCPDSQPMRPCWGQFKDVGGGAGARHPHHGTELQISFIYVGRIPARKKRGPPVGQNLRGSRLIAY